MIERAAPILVASRAPIPLGVVRWPDRPVATVVVKQAFELTARGVAPPAPAAPLGLDRDDGAGLLLHPSDFAPAKLFCDVGIVGAALHDPRGPVRIVVEPMRRLVERASALGPRRVRGALGDPTDRASAGEWAAHGFDLEVFQWSAREQRVARTQLPLSPIVDVGELRFAPQLTGPAPEVALVVPSGAQHPQRVPLWIDAIAIDVAARRVELAWRGHVDLPVGAAAVLVVEIGMALASYGRDDLLAWPRREAIEPAAVRAQSAPLTPWPPPRAGGALDAFGGDDEGGAVTSNIALDGFGGDDEGGAVTSNIALDGFGADDESGAITSNIALDGFGGDGVRSAAITANIHVSPPSDAALPFRSRLEAPADPGRERDAVAALSAPAPTPRGLPFAPASAPPPPPRSALPFQPASAHPGSRPAPDAGRPPSLDPGARSVAALPFVAAPGPTPSRAPPAQGVAPSSRPPTVLPFAVVAPGVPEAPPAAATRSDAPGTPGLTAAQFGAIKAELWSGEPRAATLRKHGLTELGWRIAERRFARAIERGGGDDARRLVRRLRAEVARRPCRRGA
jgi:hypothetical protein